jgi:hypothetical protein
VYQTPGWLYAITQDGGAGLSAVALTVVPPVELGIAKGLAFAHRSFGGPEEIFDPMYAQVDEGALAQGQHPLK